MAKIFLVLESRGSGQRESHTAGLGEGQEVKLAKRTETEGLLTGRLPASGLGNSSLDRRAPHTAGHLPSMAPRPIAPLSHCDIQKVPLHISKCPLGMAPLVEDHRTRC